MNSFIRKGNIGYCISKTELKTVSGYVVCRDGKSVGVFEELPEEYKNLNLRQRLEHSIYLSLDLCGGIKEKYIQGNKII